MSGRCRGAGLPEPLVIDGDQLDMYGRKGHGYLLALLDEADEARP